MPLPPLRHRRVLVPIVLLLLLTQLPRLGAPRLRRPLGRLLRLPCCALRCAARLRLGAPLALLALVLPHLQRAPLRLRLLLIPVLLRLLQKLVVGLRPPHILPHSLQLQQPRSRRVGLQVLAQLELRAALRLDQPLRHLLLPRALQPRHLPLEPRHRPCTQRPCARRPRRRSGSVGSGEGWSTEAGRGWPIFHRPLLLG